MFSIKNNATVAMAIAAFLGLEVCGFYYVGHRLDTRLSRLENGIESVREADAAMTSRIEAHDAKPEAAKLPGTLKANDQKPAAGAPHITLSGKAASRVQKMLPFGTDLKDASAGFKNEKQFISAAYVSRDLRIPFARLKTKITGTHAVSIEAAIRELRPDLTKAKAKAEVEKGQRQAVEIVKLGKSAGSLT